PLPDSPTSALPGTAKKVAVLTERAGRYQTLWHPQDARDPGLRATAADLVLLCVRPRADHKPLATTTLSERDYRKIAEAGGGNETLGRQATCFLLTSPTWRLCRPTSGNGRAPEQRFMKPDTLSLPRRAAWRCPLSSWKTLAVTATCCHRSR